MFLLNRLVNVYFNQHDSSIIDKILAYFFNSYWYNFASYILNQSITMSTKNIEIVVAPREPHRSHSW
jgi:hypothetical protein